MEIPYWWDGSIDYLINQLSHKCTVSNNIDNRNIGWKHRLSSISQSDFKQLHHPTQHLTKESLHEKEYVSNNEEYGWNSVDMM